MNSLLPGAPTCFYSTGQDTNSCRHYTLIAQGSQSTVSLLAKSNCETESFMDFEVERALVQSFIRPAKRGRWMELLNRSNGRHKLLASLAHFRDLDPETTIRIPDNQQDALSIERILIELGAPTTCYLVSENSDWDGKEMGLREALKLVVGYGLGTLKSCGPGLLGYFEGEGSGDRIVLKKASR